MAVAAGGKVFAARRSRSGFAGRRELMSEPQEAASESMSGGVGAAVDVDGLPGHPRRLRRGQIDTQRADVVRKADAANGRIGAGRDLTSDVALRSGKPDH